MEYAFNLVNLSQQVDYEIHSAGARTNHLKTYLKGERGKLAKISNEIYENTAKIGILSFYVLSNVRGKGIPDEPIRRLLAKIKFLLEKNLKLCNKLQDLMPKRKPDSLSFHQTEYEQLVFSLIDIKKSFLRIKSSTEHMIKLVG